MHFHDSDDDGAFRREARAWLKATFERPSGAERPAEPFVGEVAEEGVLAAKQVQAQLAAARFAAISWPVEFGGRGGTVVQQLIFDDEAAPFRLPTILFHVGLSMVGPTIMVHGTDPQRGRYLNRLLRGEEIWCQLFSEPGAGSDLAALSTRAVRVQGGWRITGQKVWTSGADHADFGILPARTDPSQSGHRGLTLFLVDMRAPGIHIRPLRQMTGPSHFAEVFLDDVAVADRGVLGDVGDGWSVMGTTLASERVMTAGPGFDIDPHQLIALARTGGGRHGATDPRLRQELADVYVRSHLLRLTRYRMLTALGQGRAPDHDAALVKLQVGQLLGRATDLALRLQGAHGTLASTAAPLAGAWQRTFLSAPALRIGGGTDEIQRNIIAERILGLPRDNRLKVRPWLDAGPMMTAGELGTLRGDGRDRRSQPASSGRSQRGNGAW